MTKAEIVAKVAEQVKVTKKVAEGAFQAIIGCIEGALKKGEKTIIVGFGTFSVADRKARMGRNPQTGKEIKIAAKKVPKFTAGTVLKAVVNGKTIAKKPAKKAPAKPKKK
ncbi:MAG: HU family DNA-binding protein [Proteobacteria bacterium]|nr:HU family DNA-binding protein [Pseudomonadota bacterium]